MPRCDRLKKRVDPLYLPSGELNPRNVCDATGVCEHSRDAMIGVQTELKTVRSRCRTAMKRVRGLLARELWPHSKVPDEYEDIERILREAILALEQWRDRKL